jgi:hypothetical protein
MRHAIVVVLAVVGHVNGSGRIEMVMLVLTML